MISLFGYSLSALAPWFLLGVPCGAALLVFIYRARGATTEVVISTLFLVRQLPEQLSARKRFSPPFQFWIELAAISLLSLAAAGIFLTDGAKRVAVVVDASLSMSAQSSPSATRFDDAVRLASTDVASTITPTRFSVFRAGSTVSRVSELNISGAAAALSLRSVAPSLEQDHLQGAIASLLNDGSFDAVWVYTDKVFSDGGGTPRLKVTTIPSDPEQIRNTWVRNVSTSSEGLIVVDLESLAQAGTSVEVRAECFNTGGAGIPQATPPVTVRLVRGAPQSVQLTPPSRAWSFCHVVATDRQPGSDALPIDNEGWIVREALETSVQLISPLTEKELGLSRLNGFTFTHVSSVSDPLFSRSVPSLFHRTAAPTGMRAPTMLVYPQQGPLPWGGEVGAAPLPSVAVTRWEHAHPLLQYVNPTLLSIPQARTLACPEAAQQVLTSSSGPLACAGESGGNRYLVTGFELFPFDGARSPTVSIVTLNALKWLFTPHGSGAASLSTPGTITLPEGSESVRYAAPALESPAVSAARTVSVEKPGVLAFESKDSPARELRAINVFSDEESNLAASAPLDAPQGSALPRVANRTPIPWAPWLAALAFIVLLLDIVRRIRNRSVWGVR